MRDAIGRGKICALVIGICISSTAANAACVQPPVTEQAIQQFRSNPASLISPGSENRAIEGIVRDLAGTDATLAAEIVRLAATVAPRWRMAIAAGLAQAATACGIIDQEAALLIQRAVASFPDGDFQAAFAAVAGDLSTAATAAAAASADSSVGSVVVTNPTRASRSTTPFRGGGSTPLVQITSGGTSIGAVNGTTSGIRSTTAGEPVSATR
jgi:hypothetical protein